ncbi:hypothetical protein AAF712_014419 [Marasmius tenuissimus]|uniref:Uncharacterized protein n=1 Tax=Marasmius tenuissimus TaxID=585030 RepID=A0ABR2ZB56_9AGAR
MTSATTTTGGGATRAPSDVGGSKPRPRRKGSGEGGNGTGGPRAAGDRGRYTRSNGYAIYQPQTKTPINQQNNQNQPYTKASTTGQQGKKGMFSVGNEEDEDEWEDDDDEGDRSSSMSRSRSRSGCSVSPAAPPPPQKLTPNGDAHSEGSRPARSSSSSTQPTVAPTSVVTNGDALVSKSTQRPPLTQQQPQQPPKQPNTVLGPNGRKIVISTDDDDDDFDDDDDDEDDWEEEEEEEVEAGKEQDTLKGTMTVPPNANIKVQEVDGTDNDWTSASEDEGSRNDGGEANATVTTNFTTRTGATDATRGTATTHATSVYTNGDASRGKGKDYLENTQRPAPPNKSSPPTKPQHYPNPPAHQVLQRAHSSRYVGGTGGLTQLPQQPPHVKRQHSQQPQQQQHQGQAPRPNQRHHHHHPNPRQPRHPSVDISQAALEAQRQREMSDKIFEKIPKRAWSGLSRTGSGLLSQLMNPDPEIFPAHHPYRSRYSSGDVAMPKGVARLGVAPLTPTTPTVDSKQMVDERERPVEQQQQPRKEVKQGGISAGAAAPHAHVAPPPAQAAASPPPRSTQPQRKSSANYGSVGRPPALGMKAGKSAAALPVADAVTAASVKDNGMVKPKKDGSTVKSPVGGGVYRPKARPHDAELEDTDTEDSQANETQSVVQRQLAIIAGKASKQNQRKLSGAAARPDIPPRAVTDTTLPANAHANTQVNNPPASQIQRTQSQHVPGATARTTAPLPLGYPYNLPLTAEPSSPRTTRQRMLGKEMSESVRSNLLWTRHLNRADTLGPRRQSTTNVAATTNVNGHAGHGEASAAPPAPANISAVPSLVRLSAKKKPGRGQFVDAAGVGESSVHEAGWAGDRPPPTPRRRSSAAVTGVGQQDQDGDGIQVGGGNEVTRTRSWAGLAGGAEGMTRIP